MKRATILVLVGLGVASTATAAAPVKTTLTVAGLGCKGCPAALERRLAKTPGVVGSAVHADRGQADVSYDPDTTDAGEIAESLLKHRFAVTLAPWEPVSASFNGCSNGFCGSRRPHARVHSQPGASIGDDVYCPVSGVVLSIKDSTLSEDFDGKRIFVCCEGCLRYIRANRARVLALRGELTAK